MEPIVNVYVSLYKNKLRTLDQIPPAYQAAVRAALEKEGYIL